MTHIFVSYSRVDREFVVPLVARLRKIYGHDAVWFDANLSGGDIWWNEILDEIARADIFLYVLSNDSVESAYCQAEFTEARRLRKGVVTVQVRARTQLTGDLSSIHYIDMTTGVTDGDALTDLYSAINKRAENLPTGPPLQLQRTPRPDSPPELPKSVVQNKTPSAAPSRTVQRTEHDPPPQGRGRRLPLVIMVLLVIILAVGLVARGLPRANESSGDARTPVVAGQAEAESAISSAEVAPPTGDYADQLSIAFRMIDIVDESTDGAFFQMISDGAPNRVTVFLPHDGAFQQFMAESGLSEEALFGDAELLSEILFSHIVIDRLTAEELRSVANADTNSPFRISTALDPDRRRTLHSDDDAIWLDDGAYIVHPNLQQDQQSVFHVIDAVLGLPDANAQP